MPTYEYKCKECEHEWDVEQSIKADPEKKCPKCKKESAIRMVSGGLGFSLLGTGWFKDGY